MARLHSGLAVLVATLICLFLMSAAALGARPRAHRVSRCGKAGVHNGRRASVRVSHRPSCQRRSARTHRRAAPRHHAAVKKTGSRSSVADHGVCANATLMPSQSNVEAIRAATLCLVNRERAAHGEGELHANGHLQQAAQGHTESMAFGNYFEHLGPGGQTPLQRIRSTGYIYSSQLGYELGENIAWATGYLATPAAIVSAWMGSPGHRANILDGHFRDSGIGVSPHPPTSVSHGQAGGLYTQDFGTITG
jgi:uncharacterized protein YkwD